MIKNYLSGLPLLALPYFHKIIHSEEFRPEFHLINVMKKFMEGREYAYQVKSQPYIICKLRCPIIFVSIEYVVTDDEALKSRLYITELRMSYGKTIVSRDHCS